MSNSPLVTYTNITRHKTSPRNHVIDTITIHCLVAQWTAKQGCDYFVNTDRESSANYVVGKDGSIGLCVDEKDRSWCTSSGVNDHRAVTIEVASDMQHPYAVTKEAYVALINLVADICKRNNIKKLVWSENKNERMNHLNGCNMTVHRDYANKACPGEYLYTRHADIAKQVNEKLGNKDIVNESVKFQPYAVRVKVANLHIRKGAGTNYATNGYIKPGVYTIMEEKDGKGATKWGKLKSGVGWISLDYVERV